MKNILKNNNGALAKTLAIVLGLVITLGLIGNLNVLAHNTNNIIIQGNEKVLSIDQRLH